MPQVVERNTTGSNMVFSGALFDRNGYLFSDQPFAFNPLPLKSTTSTLNLLSAVASPTFASIESLTTTQQFEELTAIDFTRILATNKASSQLKSLTINTQSDKVAGGEAVFTFLGTQTVPVLAGSSAVVVLIAIFALYCFVTRRKKRTNITDEQSIT